jgi:hypothetical protein
LIPGEKTIITKYLETGDKLEGFRVLLCRIKKHNPEKIAVDEKLIKQFTSKVEEHKP